MENPQLLEPTLPRVRAEVRVSNAIVSESIAATYGFSETALDIGMNLGEGDELKPNTVTLMVDPDRDPQARGGVGIYLPNDVRDVPVVYAQSCPTIPVDQSTILLK